MLQQKAAEALAELIYHCLGRRPSPNDKLIRNICSLTCSDFNETPQAAIVTSMDVIEDQNLLSLGRVTGIHKAKFKVKSADEDRSKIQGFISRRGSELALEHLCKRFGSSLFDRLPKLWDCLTEILKPMNPQDQLFTDQAILEIADTLNNMDPQALINNIQVRVPLLSTFVESSDQLKDIVFFTGQLNFVFAIHILLSISQCILTNYDQTCTPC